MKKVRTPTRKKSSAAEDLTYADVLAIVRLIESGSRFSEFRLKSGGIEVEIQRANGVATMPAGAPPASPGPATASPGANDSPRRAHAAPDILADAHVIRAPMVGTFYRAPEPGAPPFVEVGARVEPDTIVCIIEVMKLMNSVTAGVKGVVTHVLVENAHMVEYGQALVAIKKK